MLALASYYDPDDRIIKRFPDFFPMLEIFAS